MARIPQDEEISGSESGMHIARVNYRHGKEVPQRAFCAHEYMTTAPFVVDSGDYGRILFDGPRASVG